MNIKLKKEKKETQELFSFSIATFKREKFCFITNYSPAGLDVKAHPCVPTACLGHRGRWIPRSPLRILLSKNYMTSKKSSESELHRFPRNPDMFTCDIYSGDSHLIGVKHSLGAFFLGTVISAASSGCVETVNAILHKHSAVRTISSPFFSHKHGIRFSRVDYLVGMMPSMRSSQ